MDLRDLWRHDAAVTPRYVLWLVEHLPDSSAFAAAARGGREWAPWTFQTHLLAATVNLLHAANRQRGGQRTRAPLIAPPRRRPRARRVSVAHLASLPDALPSPGASSGDDLTVGGGDSGWGAPEARR